MYSIGKAEVKYCEAIFFVVVVVLVGRLRLLPTVEQRRGHVCATVDLNERTTIDRQLKTNEFWAGNDFLVFLEDKQAIFVCLFVNRDKVQISIIFRSIAESYTELISTTTIKTNLLKVINLILLIYL